MSGLTRWGSRLPAAAGLLAAAALVVVGCTAAPSSPSPSATTPSPSATTSRAPFGSPSTSVDPFDVSVGDCLDENTGSGELTSVPVVSCDTPHVGEAYASVEIEARGAFPGLDAIAEAARGCEAPFAEFVGRPLAGSTLRVTYLHPTEQSWDGGDREILCVVSDPAGPVTGTLEGAAR